MNEVQIQEIAKKKEQLKGCIRSVSGRLIYLPGILQSYQEENTEEK